MGVFFGAFCFRTCFCVAFFFSAFGACVRAVFVFVVFFAFGVFFLALGVAVRRITVLAEARE